MARNLKYARNGDNYPPAGDWQTIDELKVALKVGRSWLEAEISKSSYEPEWRRHRSHARAIAYLHYSPECYRHLQKRAEALHRHPALGQWLTLRQAAEQLACSCDWIVTATTRHNLPQPKLRRSRNNRLVQAISPATLRRLRHLQLPLPPPDYWSINQLATSTGWTRGTILRRLQKKGYQPTYYRLPEGGSSSLFYPPEVIPLLGKKPGYISPAGDWLTANRIMLRLGRSEAWVKTRVSRPHLAAASELRLDDSNTIKRHYPPWVVKQLKLESNMPQPTNGSKRGISAINCPPAGTWSTITEINAALHCSRYWIEAQAAMSPYQPEWRRHRNPKHRYAFLHYPPEFVQEIKALLKVMAQQYPIIGRWVTLQQAAEKLGHSRGWILRTIDHHGLPQPSLRRVTNIRFAQAISPKTMQRLRQLH